MGGSTTFERCQLCRSWKKPRGHCCPPTLAHFECQNLRSSFISNKSERSSGGGAVYIFQSNVTFINNSFNGNSAIRGGALFTENISSIVIFDSLFQHNTAEIGGAIYSENDTFTVSDSEFCYNSAGTIGTSDTKGGSGGAMFLLDCVSNITGSRFMNNSARNFGGGFACERGTINIVYGYFHGNSAKVGCALCSEYSLVSIGDSEFSHNNVHSAYNTTNDDLENQVGEGGAIFLMNCSSVIAGNAFTANSANNSGGAVSTVQSTVMITGNGFELNNAYTGGAIAYTASDRIHISESNFTINTSQFSGALYIRNGHVSITSTNFYKNTGFLCGGAIFDEAVTSLSLTVTSVVILHGLAVQYSCHFHGLKLAGVKLVMVRYIKEVE